MYVKFNSSGRVEATQQTEATGFQEVDDSLLPYAILEDGVVRAQTEAEIAADEAAYVSAGNAISNRNKRNRLLNDSDWVVTKALEAGGSVPADWYGCKYIYNDGWSLNPDFEEQTPPE